MVTDLDISTVVTPAEPQARFTTTHWSVILEARERNGPVAEKAFQELCERYWRPVYGFIRRQSHLPDDPEDLTQEFFCRVLARDFLRNVNPALGRFRSFLLASVKHFLADARDRANAQKRGGARKVILSLDGAETENGVKWEPSEQMDPEKEFDRRWALAMLSRVLNTLEEEAKSQGKTAQFEALKGFLVGDKAGGGYAAAAERLNTSEGGIKNQVWRLRIRCRELFLMELATTVATPQDAESELRHLLLSLGG